MCWACGAAAAGLSGSATAVRAAADAYKVYYREMAREGASDYTIDHSAFLYLMDRDGRFIGFLPPGTSADRMAEALRGIAAQALNRGG